jgi:hypothetical protein
MTNEPTQAEAPVAALDRLPREIEPGRDLWPDIEGRLSPRSAAPVRSRRGWGLGAVAASVAVAFLAGILLGRQGPAPEATGPRTADVSSDPLTLASAAAPSVAAALEATEREYQAAWRGFEPLGTRPSLLEQNTVDALERSWLAMKEAETALLTALDEHPENPYLADKLLELRGQQLDFMRALHRLERDSRRET